MTGWFVATLDNLFCQLGVLFNCGAHHVGGQLRDQIMDLTECSKRTAQLAITEACRQGSIVQADGQYRLPL